MDRTSGVILRDWEQRDVDPYVHWMAPGHRWQTLNAPYLPHEPVDAAQAERIRKRIAEQRWETPRTRLIVADRDTGASIGVVSWYWESVETDWMSIGVTLYDPEHWGRGFGTEAVGLWTDYLFGAVPRLVRLGFRTWSGNVGMMRIADHLGYLEEARFRRARIVDGVYYDGMGYGVLREEWAERWPAGYGRRVTRVDLFAPADPADLIVGLKDAVGTAHAAGSPLSATEWAVLDVWLLEAEVYNGGFHQFFWNSAGDRAVETVVSLERIGAPVTAGIVARALAVFGAAPSPDREARTSQMGTWTDTERAALAALDEVFCEAPEPLTALLAEHCRSHRTAFAGR